ncbi:hypothetical protein HK102_007101, partial [Quaeritorhiza haematococci]
MRAHKSLEKILLSGVFLLAHTISATASVDFYGNNAHGLAKLYIRQDATPTDAAPTDAVATTTDAVAVPTPTGALVDPAAVSAATSLGGLITGVGLTEDEVKRQVWLYLAGVDGLVTGN